MTAPYFACAPSFPWVFRSQCVWLLLDFLTGLLFQLSGCPNCSKKYAPKRPAKMAREAHHFVDEAVLVCIFSSSLDNRTTGTASQISFLRCKLIAAMGEKGS